MKTKNYFFENFILMLFQYLILNLSSDFGIFLGSLDDASSDFGICEGMRYSMEYPVHDKQFSTSTSWTPSHAMLRLFKP